MLLEMLRMTVLASGSKGNSTVLTSTATGTSVLVDCGLSCRETMKRMRFAGEDPAKLSAIIITHEHQDHVNGVGVLARKLNIPVYFTGATHEAWKRWVTPKPKRMSREQWFAEQRARNAEVAARSSTSGSAARSVASAFAPAWQHAAPASAQIASVQASAQAAAAAAVAAEQQPNPAAAAESLTDAEAAALPSELLPLFEPEEQDAPDPTALPAVEYFESGKPFAIEQVGVMPFTVPHDAADPVGFVFTVEGVRVAMVTDLGYMPTSVKVNLRGCDVVYIESNHDLEMLRNGPYPWSVKQRVLSRVGHLSNDALAEFFNAEYDGAAQWIVLAHLSEANNDPEIARACAERALGTRSNLIANRVVMARQNEPLAAIVL